MSDAPGRACPLRYRHGARAIAEAPTRHASTLYVVGGLYGNIAALDAIEQMVRAEAAPAVLCFNGDFNWFNIDDQQFMEINQRVLAHDAICGNVEAELDPAADDAGCGCAYPDSVDADLVARSNRIHAQLKSTAARHGQWLARLSALPMVARYQVGHCRVGVVHGDAEALAGWRFDAAALDDSRALPWLRSVFDASQVDVFASSHTCLPALREVALGEGSAGWVVNNGAAGMPNFAGDLSGLCTRISLAPSPHQALHEVRVGGTWVSLLPVRYDASRWRRDFLAQWPPGSAAWESYFKRITLGPAFAPSQALPAARVS